MKNAPGPSQRQLRVGEQIKHVLADIFARGHFTDPVLIDNAARVTVTEVRASPDLKYATAYVMTLNGEQMEEVLHALNIVAPHLQKDISKQTQLKFTPKLSFKKDETFDQALHLENIINNLKYSDQEE